MRGTSGAETAEHCGANAQDVDDDGGRPSDGVHGGVSGGRDVGLVDECVLAQAIRELPRGEIVRRLPHRDRAAFAAASSTSQAAVLEGCENAIWTATCDGVGVQVYGKLRGKVPRDTPALLGWPEPSTGMTFYRRAGGDAQDPSCIERIKPTWSPNMELQNERPVSITPDMTGLRRLDLRAQRLYGDGDGGDAWLPESVAAGIRVLGVRQCQVRRVPAGMSELRVLHVVSCKDLDPDEWLPSSSCARLQSLVVWRSPIRRLPEGAPALEKLFLTGCANLARDTLPPCSSVPRLRELTLDGTKVEQVPPGMVALETLSVAFCEHLYVDDWLPESSRAKLRRLDAGSTRLQRVPDEMSALEELRLEHCAALNNEEWLPESSCGRLRLIGASRSSVTRIPENMPALEELEVEFCPLVSDFLPASSADKVRVLRAQCSALMRLPPGMRALEELRIACCERLDEDFLPLSSAGRVRVLHARRSALQKLPRGLAALEELDVRECELLDDDMDPHVAARLKAWDVSGSDLRLPMEQSRGKVRILV